MDIYLAVAVAMIRGGWWLIGLVGVVGLTYTLLAPNPKDHA